MHAGILWEALGGSLISVLQIALIVIPLMVLIEIIKDMNCSAFYPEPWNH